MVVGARTGKMDRIWVHNNWLKSHAKNVRQLKLGLPDYLELKGFKDQPGKV